MMKTLRVAILISILAMSAAVAAGAIDASSTDCQDALVAMFVFGDGDGWMGCGFVVGDGSWVATTADLVSEPINSDTQVSIKFVTILSYYTGDAYRAELKYIDRKTNLALFKLPVRGLPAVPLAGSEGFAKAKTTTIGQIVTGGSLIGFRWDTTIYALGRTARSAKAPALAVKKWTARNAVFAETKDVNWLFASKIDPEDNPPRASLVWKTGAGAVGIYNSRLILGEGPKAIIYGQCLPSTTITKALNKASLEDPTKPSLPTIARDKVATQGLQSIWNVLTNVILAQRAKTPTESSSRWADAHKASSELVAARPDSAFANLVLGVSLMGEAKTDESLKSLDKAVALDGNSAYTFLSRGAARVVKGMAKEAEADFRKAIEKSPADIKPLLALADLLAADKASLAEAAEFATKAVKLEPQYPPARMTLALILKKQETYDRAIAEFKEILKIVPEWGAAKAALAATYEDSGDLTNAEAQYRDIVKLVPDNPDALLTLASFLADHDKKDEAKKLVAQVLEMKPPQELETAAKELQKKL